MLFRLAMAKGVECTKRTVCERECIVCAEAGRNGGEKGSCTPCMSVSLVGLA